MEDPQIEEIKELINNIAKERQEAKKVEWLIVNYRLAKLLEESQYIIKSNYDAARKLYTLGTINKSDDNLHGVKVYVDAFLPDTDILIKRHGYNMEKIKIDWE